MKTEELKIGQTVFVKGIITDFEKDEILDLEIHTSENNFYVNSSDVYASLDQPKPAVPQFMVDWVDDSREHGYEFDEWFYYSNQPLEVYKWLNTKNKRQKELNALALVTLIVNGPDAVTVEKEKLYTVEILDKTLVKVIKEDGSYFYKMSSYFLDSKMQILRNLTESEIKEADERLWQWKKEVEY